MSILKKWGFVKDEGETEAPKRTSGQSSGVPPVKPVDTRANYPSITTASGTDYGGLLDSALAAAKTGKLDFLEFYRAVTNPSLAGLLEPQRFVVTYPTYQAMGVSVEDLIASGGKYVAVLDEQNREFQQELLSERKTLVEDRQAQIQKEQQEVEALTEQIRLKTENIGRLNDEANKATTTLNAEEAAFNMAMNAKKSSVIDHIAKIKNYLNANAPK
jgi:hypothetical protein